MDGNRTVSYGRKDSEVLNAGPGDHAVAFYSQDKLATLAGMHLLPVIGHGGTAILVARAENRSAVNAWLSQAGVDLAEAWADGSYVLLDAEELLSRFTLGGRPDPALFWEVMSPVLAAACRSNGPVRVFGEMVALLWETGQPDAAVELEALWDEIGRQYPFALLCGYPAVQVSDDAHSDALAQVCGAHSTAIGAPPGLTGLVR
jgi:hypothetical protein